jgi:hypothetical protein
MCTVFNKNAYTPAFLLGFLPRRSLGNTNFTSTDFLATKKILRRTSKKQLKMFDSSQDLKLN